ncbi:MAG TPA: alkaline phosphatase family protein [Thermoanaerobaculia bacterium]|nr:alkaline phosphatase family protein [Thermoanaerobaculia bacterium]
MLQSSMPQIKKIVVLMLENRSLDNLLGWLYPPGSPNLNIYPQGSSANFDGLLPNTFFQPYKTVWGDVVHYPVVPAPDNLGKNQDAIPYWDPTEEMYARTTWNGVLNQMFGDYRRITGMPAATAQPGMSGFYQDYYNYEMADWKGMDILWTYTPRQLPIINGLARAYGVSDAWFCSVPTQTNPNRAFSIIGTSQGRNNNTWNAVEQFPGKTVFNGIGRKKSWGLYFDKPWKDTRSYTEYTFPGLSNSGGDIGLLDRFFTLAKSGDLPDFTYLEPRWGYGLYGPNVQGWDYHPPTHCNPGETFLFKVFHALYNGKKWEETLLVVTFDEHGGTFDHVPPLAKAINPDGRIGEYGFDFTRFGARVPTILISPFVKRNTVFRAPAGSKYPFDHTSLIKTFLMWAGVDPNDPTLELGRRMPAAPTFEGVLSKTIVNDDKLLDLVPPPEPSYDTEMMPGTNLPGPYSGEPLNALFEGIPFASVRAILANNRSLVGIMEWIERYLADPQAFEAALEKDEAPVL